MKGFTRRLVLKQRHRDTFIHELLTGAFDFSIIGDEVTDKYANQEISSVCLRFLDLNNDVSPKVKDAFFDFVNLDRTTGESIANAI